MAIILNIETATTVCSVALAKDGNLLCLREQNEGYTHAEKLTVFIEEVIAETKIKFSDLDTVAVSIGPGSYTGLRIGLSVAKGLCYALDKPLIAIPTLKSLAAQFSNSQFPIPNSFLCPMIDARRMEVYCALYDGELNVAEAASAKIISENSFSKILKTNTVYFFGDGSAKCKEVLSHHTNAVFVDGVFCSAESMIHLSEEKFLNKDFDDMALSEPFYLKEFVAK